MPDGTVQVRCVSQTDAGIDINYAAGQAVPGLRVIDSAGNLLFVVNTTGSVNIKSYLSSLTPIVVGGSPYAVLGTDFYVPVDATGGAVTITLYAASVGNSTFSRPLIIQKTDASVNAVTINRVGSDTVDGQTSVILESQFSTAFMSPNGLGKWALFHPNVPDLHNLKSVTSVYTITYSDNKVLANATGGAFAVNLPAANSVPAGWEVRVEKTDVSANAVTITRAGADTIEGATTVALGAQFANSRLTSDGVSIWYKL